jgi:hypothetical protein
MSCAGGLPGDPRTWCREDVCLFLQYCEREFDLEKIDMDKFVMNGESLVMALIVGLSWSLLARR